MRKKFSIRMSDGTLYNPPENHMIVMNSQGVFFLIGMEDYYPSVRKLSSYLKEGYEVVWKGENK